MQVKQKLPGTNEISDNRAIYELRLLAINLPIIHRMIRCYYSIFRTVFSFSLGSPGLNGRWDRQISDIRSTNVEKNSKK